MTWLAPEEFRKKLTDNPTKCEIVARSWIDKYTRDWNLFPNLATYEFQFPFEGYYLDFYFPAQMVALEIDGSAHNDIRQGIHDALRDAHLESVGVRTIRIKNAALMDPHRAKYVIRKTLRDINGELEKPKQHHRIRKTNKKRRKTKTIKINGSKWYTPQQFTQYRDDETKIKR